MNGMKPIDRTLSVAAEATTVLSRCADDACVCARVDQEAIARCRGGEVEAFSILVDRYRNAIYSFAYRMTGDAEEANDIAQETFVRAYRALPRFRDGSPFLPWLFTIAANLCRSWLRAWRRRPMLIAEVMDRPEEGDGNRSAQALAEDERRREVREAVRSLPTKYRIVLILRHLRDMSYEEIGAILGLPISTVEHRLRTARELLRQRLAD